MSIERLAHCNSIEHTSHSTFYEATCRIHITSHEILIGPTVLSRLKIRSVAYAFIAVVLPFFLRFYSRRELEIEVNKSPVLHSNEKQRTTDGNKRNTRSSAIWESGFVIGSVHFTKLFMRSVCICEYVGIGVRVQLTATQWMLFTDWAIQSELFEIINITAHVALRNRNQYSIAGSRFHGLSVN